MKIIFLNCWNGKLKRKLFSFLEKEQENTQIFCFQEVDEKLFKQITKLLPNFSGVTHLKRFNNRYGWEYNLAIFVSKELKIKGKLRSLLKGDLLGDSVTLEVSKGNKNFWICDVHGVASPGDKKDTTDRIKQTKGITKFFENKKQAVIIGGDFSLDLNTNSVSIFEESGYRNLIKDFKIKTTRNKIAWDYFKNNKSFVKQYYADFCFTNNKVKINNFEVPNSDVSDHLPLILEFEV